MSNSTQNLTVQVELVKLFAVKENINGTQYRNCHVKLTDPVTGTSEVIWARIWETTISNGAVVGDMLNARLEQWLGTDGTTKSTITVFAGSDAKQASLDILKNVLAQAVPATDLNKPI
jgi:hypothetical protein